MGGPRDLGEGAGPPVVRQLRTEPLDEAPIKPCVMRDDEAVPGELGGRHEVDRLARHHIGCDAGQPCHIGGDRLLWLAEGGRSEERREGEGCVSTGRSWWAPDL